MYIVSRYFQNAAFFSLKDILVQINQRWASIDKVFLTDIGWMKWGKYRYIIIVMKQINTSIGLLYVFIRNIPVNIQ